MTILKAKDSFVICAKEEDIIADKKHFMVLDYGVMYDPENNFKGINETGRRKTLSSKKIQMYNEMYSAAESEWQNKRMAILTTKQKDALSDNLNSMLVQVLAKQSADAIFEATMPKVRQKIFEEFGLIPQIHEIRTPFTNRKITGVTHEKFDTVLNLVNGDIPVFLTGAAGTGKNVMCKQIADSLGLEFYFTNAVTQEYKLTGFIDANGHFHETQFYKAFKNGGLFFLDEMDGSIPEVLIMLNAAIANRYFDFPNEKVKAHKDFRVIAAGNTFGTGADIEYTGRYQLDAASLDRFALVEIDYSPKIEDALANGDNELCEFIRAFRKATNKVGIKHLATYRSVERISKLANTMELSEVMRIALLKNLTKDDINVITHTMKENNGFISQNRYYVAACAAR